MDRSELRRKAVADAVADVRAVEAAHGSSREGLALVKQRLMKLAALAELFTPDDFPPPGRGEKRTSCLYRVSEDDDHRFALYVNSASGRVDTPAHNHTTWAVIVGIAGDELNRFYERDADGGVRETGTHVVRRGTGVAFLPDDLHSIHIAGMEPLLNFHMYGLALEQLHERRYYKPDEKTWRVFPAHSDIREARGR